MYRQKKDLNAVILNFHFLTADLKAATLWDETQIWNLHNIELLGYNAQQKKS